jgi:hypothetical protein
MLALEPTNPPVTTASGWYRKVDKQPVRARTKVPTFRFSPSLAFAWGLRRKESPTARHPTGKAWVVERTHFACPRPVSLFPLSALPFRQPKCLARQMGTGVEADYHPVREAAIRAMNEARTFNQPKTMTKQLVRISILQSSKIVTVLYVFMGFIYTLIGIPMIIFGSNRLRIIGIIYLLGPIFAGIFGFIFFVLFAAIYNVLAGWLGGFEVEIKNID